MTVVLTALILAVILGMFFAGEISIWGIPVLPHVFADGVLHKAGIWMQGHSSTVTVSPAPD